MRDLLRLCGGEGKTAQDVVAIFVKMWKKTADMASQWKRGRPFCAKCIYVEKTVAFLCKVDKTLKMQDGKTKGLLVSKKYPKK